jgi:putative transposase
MEYRKGSHSIYDLKYHVVFCTKYRYRVLTGQVADRTREIIREIMKIFHKKYKRN